MQDRQTAFSTDSPAITPTGRVTRGIIRRLQHLLHSYPTIVPAFILLLSVALFSALAGERFFTPFNLSLVLQQITIIAIVGVAQTIVILTAGIDLSVGAIVVLATMVMGRTAYLYGVPAFLTLPAGLLVGVFCGWMNGSLISMLRLPPFIVTLGTWNIFFAVALWYSQGETVREEDIRAVAPLLLWTGHTIDVLGARVTVGSILMIGLYGLFYYILHWTAFGRHIYAVGDDPEAARLAGVRTRRTLIKTYTVAGLICAVGGWVLIGRTGVITPQAGYTANLDSITAAVIGGTSLFGGRGSIFGTIIGALIVGVFHNGLALYGVDVLWRSFTVGTLIIIAVALDQWIRQEIT
jgi:fructose transport system permease protein